VTLSITLDDAHEERLRRIAEATGVDAPVLVRDAIDRWLEAGGPSRMLNQLVLDMANTLIDAKKSVATTIADLKRIALTAEQERQCERDWIVREERARTTGQEALADEAKGRVAEHRRLAETYDAERDAQESVVRELKTSLQSLHERVEAAKRMKARVLRRLANEELQETIAKLDKATGEIERLAATLADDDP
jgi:phage shock protein A